MVGSVYENDEPKFFDSEADAAFQRFRRHLVAALLAATQENEIALIAHDLHEGGALRSWTDAMLASLASRSWQALVHVDRGERKPEDGWPNIGKRRWGPPLTPADFAERHGTPDAKRPFSSLMVRVKGHAAGALLSFCGRQVPLPLRRRLRGAVGSARSPVLENRRTRLESSGARRGVRPRGRRAPTTAGEFRARPGKGRRRRRRAIARRPRTRSTVRALGRARVRWSGRRRRGGRSLLATRLSHADRRQSSSVQALVHLAHHPGRAGPVRLDDGVERSGQGPPACHRANSPRGEKTRPKTSLSPGRAPRATAGTGCTSSSRSATAPTRGEPPAFSRWCSSVAPPAPTGCSRSATTRSAPHIGSRCATTHRFPEQVRRAYGRTLDPEDDLDLLKAEPSDKLVTVRFDVEPPSLLDLLSDKPDVEHATAGHSARLDELLRVAVNQTARAADDKLRTGLAREPYRNRLRQLLCGAVKSPVLVVGPPGSGKSTIIARAICDLLDSDDFAAHRNLDRVHNVLSLRGRHIIAGMSYVGQWEARCMALLQRARKKKLVLWADDVHAWGPHRSNRRERTFARRLLPGAVGTPGPLAHRRVHAGAAVGARARRAGFRRYFRTGPRRTNFGSSNPRYHAPWQPPARTRARCGVRPSLLPIHSQRREHPPRRDPRFPARPSTRSKRWPRSAPASDDSTTTTRSRRSSLATSFAISLVRRACPRHCSSPSNRSNPAPSSASSLNKSWVNQRRSTPQRTSFWV